MFTVQKTQQAPDGSTKIVESVDVPIEIESAGGAAIDAYVAADAAQRAALLKARQAELAPTPETPTGTAADASASTRRAGRGATSTKE